MLVLSAADVRRALPMRETIEAMKQALAVLSAGRANVPERTHLDIGSRDGVTLVMPAFVEDPECEALAVKVVSLFGGNPGRGLPRIQAAVLVLEPDTGQVAAVLEGASLTAIRTGAASGAATDLLANSGSRTAAIFGAGVQARTQLEAICTVRPIETVWIHDPQPAAVETFVDEMAGRGPIPTDLRPALSPEQAVAEADIVSTATTARLPVFHDCHLKPGVHINAIGSYQPDVREIPAETVARALVVVDSREAALAETGDLIQPIRQGLIGPEHVHAELGELVSGSKTGRSAGGQVTLFKAVGVAVEDAVAARLALARARTHGWGEQVRW